jgi:hypothetical protein
LNDPPIRRPELRPVHVYVGSAHDSTAHACDAHGGRDGVRRKAMDESRGLVTDHGVRRQLPGQVPDEREVLVALCLVIPHPGRLPLM